MTFFSMSDRMTTSHANYNVMTRGFLKYYSGDTSIASSIFSKSYEEFNRHGVFEEGSDCPLFSALGLAQIHFARKNYQQSLEFYKRALEMRRTMPVKARLGMAYCFYFLNKFELAKSCFRRILTMDPKCVEAYLGLAVIADKSNNSEYYFKYLQVAYKLNPNHPVVLLHLAEHFLFRKDIAQVKELC